MQHSFLMNEDEIYHWKSKVDGGRRKHLSHLKTKPDPSQIFSLEKVNLKCFISVMPSSLRSSKIQASCIDMSSL